MNVERKLSEEDIKSITPFDPSRWELSGEYIDRQDGEYFIVHAVYTIRKKETDET